MKRLEAAFIVCAIICTVVITITVVRVGHQVTKVAADVDGIALQSQQPIAKILSEVSATAESAKKTADSINTLESDNQAKYANSIAETGKVIAATKELVVRTDKALTDDGGLLPIANSAITQFSAHSTETLDALTESSKSLGFAADALNRTVSDPHIAETFAHIDIATLHLSSTSDHLDNISAMGEVEVKRLTMPASLAKRMVYGTLDVAGKVGAAFAGFK